MLFGEFITKLEKVSGKKAKEKVIADACKESPWIKDAIVATYDPFCQYYIKNGLPKVVASTKATKPVDFDEKFWTDTVQPLLAGMNQRKWNKAEVVDQLSAAFSNLNQEDREALKRIILKDLRVGVGPKGYNAALGENTLPVPDTQLCKTWDPYLNINVKGWWVTPKLNGLRGRWTVRNGRFTFLTREDYPLIGFPFIEEELKAIQEKYGLVMIDGEIFSFDLPFQTIMSIARTEKEVSPQDKAKLKFHVFNIRKETPYKTTREMVNELNAIFKNKDVYQYVTKLDYEWMGNRPEAIIAKCQSYTNLDYEGIVLRDPDVAWEPAKRNNHLMKYKIFYETDLKVVDVLFGAEGKKWESTVAALLCEGKVPARMARIGDHTIWKPVSGSVNDYVGEEIREIPVQVEASCSKCTDAERMTLTKVGRDLIGLTAEVSFQAFGDKPDQDGVYSLQFPVFQKFKNI